MYIIVYLQSDHLMSARLENIENTSSWSIVLIQRQSRFALLSDSWLCFSDPAVAPCGRPPEWAPVAGSTWQARSRPCTPSVHSKIVGIYGWSSPPSPHLKHVQSTFIGDISRHRRGESDRLPQSDRPISGIEVEPVCMYTCMYIYIYAYTIYVFSYGLYES